MRNRFDVVVEVNDKFPEYLQTNTHESCATFLWLVCDELSRRFPDERWGLLTKNNGENGYTWSNGTRTSHDAIVIPNGERVDIVSSAGTGNPTKPSWGEIPPEHWRPNNVWIDYRTVDNGDSVPIPPVPSEDALSKVIRQVDENNRFLKRVAGIWNIPFP